jgi:glutamate decarboxylase
MLSKKIKLDEVDEDLQNHDVCYASRHFEQTVPKYEFPKESMPADIAYRIVHDELNLDGNPVLNLASFVTTWMEPEAEKLLVETANKNFINQEEYPQTTEIQNRCVNMLCRLFGAPAHHQSIGTSTIGSSEAIHLAGLAMKWNWRKRRQAAGKDASKPNLVMSSSVQVCWEKFARYFEVEPRYLPLTPDRFVIDPAEAAAACDENTIGVAGILGSTYTGQFEPIDALNDAIEKVNQQTGWNIPIHVDAASGGFVAPFLQPDLIWDFRLKWVKSINVSGHKYGLVYPGIGWVLWREHEDLPEELVFHVEYLGGDQPTFSLNFSKSASQVVAQYYNFLRLGEAGYRRVLDRLARNARWLSRGLEKIGRFKILSDDHGLPVVCFSLVEGQNYTVFDLSARLRERGWIVPAYHMAPGAEKVEVLRVVLREGFSRDMAEMLITDIKRTCDELDKHSRMHRPATKKRHKAC